MRKMLFAAFFLVLFFSCGSSNSKFLGTWKLERFEYNDVNTNKWIADPSRNGYEGFIMYDGVGHMSVQITPGEYENINGQADVDSISCDSLRNITRLYSKNYSYFASYRVSGNTIKHSIVSSSHPDLCGKIVERNYEFTFDTLYLITVVSDSLRKNRLKWIRVK